MSKWMQDCLKRLWCAFDDHGGIARDKDGWYCKRCGARVKI